MKTIDDVSLDQLIKLPFLSNTGKDCVSALNGFEVVAVSSWREAVDLRGSDAASDAFSQARAHLTRALSAGWRAEYRKWNAIARLNRELMEKKLFPKVDQCVDGIHELRAIEVEAQLVKDFIRWDLMHFAAEQAYSELIQPAFYSSLIKVYEAGHFPCNWNEVWPNGRLWVL